MHTRTSYTHRARIQGFEASPALKHDSFSTHVTLFAATSCWRHQGLGLVHIIEAQAPTSPLPPPFVQCAKPLQLMQLSLHLTQALHIKSHLPLFVFGVSWTFSSACFARLLALYRSSFLFILTSRDDVSTR